MTACAMLVTRLSPFVLGNDIIHALTAGVSSSLCVTVDAFHDSLRHASYSSFSF